MATFLQRGRPTPNVAAVGDDLPPDVSFYDTPFPGISNVVISVNYCGPLGAFTESELKDETDKLNLQVARLFFNMESNGESIVKFGVGEIYTPTEATNQTIWANETITKWGGLDSDDNPCYKAVFDDQTNGTASNDSRNVALILAGVELGKKTVGNKTVVTHGFGPPGGALFDDIEPYVIAQPSTRYVLKYGSEPWYWLIAHEIGHAAYTLCHAFENYSTCAVQGADADVKSECRTGPANRQVADPDCGGDDRLKELANSIMSYSAYSGHSKLSISYVACEQKNWLGWHDKICGTPAAPPAPRIDEDDSRITVRWTSPRDDGWSPITGYYIQLTQNGPRRSMTLGPLDGDHHTFTGLTNGERYTVEVRADNMQGIGAWSDPADGVPRPRQQLPPDTPTVNAVVNGNTISASWSADDNGSPIDKWEIGGTSGEQSASTRSYRWTNQRPGTYVVRVRAHNAHGWSEWGPSNTVTVDGEDEPTLMVSRGGPGVAGSCTSASGCEWVHGSGSGWTPGAQFWIKCGDFVDTSRNIPVVYANRYVDSSGNLSWGNRICLSNSRHTVEVWTNSDDVVRAVIPAPTSVIPDRPSVRATVSGTTVEASWSANDNGSQIDKWEIEGVGEVSASTTSRPWPNQRPRTYVVRVRAHNAAGWSEWGTSNTVTVDGEDEPTLMVSRGGPGVAGSCTSASGCEWVHGSGSGWTPGAQFWIKCGDFVDTSRNIPVVYANRYVDSSGNLSWGNRICLSNSRHTVEVWTNSDDVVRAVIPAPTSVIPDRPSVRATVSGTTVEASWSANDNGSQIDKWEIEGVGEVSASTTSRPWPNQRPRTYVVRVRAHNAAGWSEWGTSNTVTVDGEDEPTLMVSRGGPGVAGSCTSASGCEWVHGSGSGWTPGAQFWIKCGDFVDTSRNIPVVYANRYVDSSGNLSWGNRICLSNSRHTVEVWTNSDDVVRAVIPAP